MQVVNRMAKNALVGMTRLHRANVWIAGFFRSLGDVLVGMDGVRGRWGHEKNPTPVQKTHKLKMTFDP